MPRSFSGPPAAGLGDVMAGRTPTTRSSLATEPPGAIARYLAAARRPLTILAFLLPLVVVYELCLVLLLPSDDGTSVHTVLAHKRLLELFDALGVADFGGLWLGGVVIVVVLFVWHLLAREPWRIDARVVAFMALESFLLALPLFVVSALIVSRFGAGAHPHGALAAALTLAAGAQGDALAGLDLWSKMAISVGAGLYEELVFRMLLIAIIHTLLVDVARVRPRTGAIVAVVVSAAAFTLYHDLGDAGGIPARVLFYLLAGLYFGGIYVTRGFGIVVGTHATYDILTVLPLD